MIDAWLDGWGLTQSARALLVLALGGVGAALIRLMFRNWFLKITARTDTPVDDIIVGAFERPLSITVLSGALWSGIDMMGPSPALAYVRDGLILSALVLAWAWALSHVVTSVLLHMLEQPGRAELVTPRTLPLFTFAGNLLVGGLAIYYFFLAWDIDVAGWLAGAGIVGVAVGFAAQSTLSNLIAGVFILADAPYQLGDFLQVEHIRGRVTEIGMRTTRLVTQDNIEIIVPNATMANATVVNESGGSSVKHRIATVVGVGYDSDLQQVREVLEKAARVPGVATSPLPRAQFREFGASGLIFHVLVWIERPEMKWDVVDAVNTRIHAELGKAGIEIPYDKLDVQLSQAGDA